MDKKKKTLRRILKKAETLGLKSLSDYEKKIFRVATAEKKAISKNIIQLHQPESPQFDLQRELKAIIPQVFAAYKDLLMNGNGIAKKTAADALKDWASQFVVEEGDLNIRFDPIGDLGEDIDDKPEAASA